MGGVLARKERGESRAGVEFAIDPESATGGQAAVMRACQGVPSAPVALIISEANGHPTLILLGIDGLDAFGSREWSLIVPRDPLLAGSVLGFMALSLDQGGQPLVSNLDVVSLR